MTAGRPTSLRELVQTAMDEVGVTSGRALDDAIVRRLGDEQRVSHTILNAILGGTYHSTPKASTVRTLATMARVPERVAFHAAGIPLREPFELPESAAELTGDQRQAVLAVVRAFAKANRASAPDVTRPEATPDPQLVFPDASPAVVPRERSDRTEDPGRSGEPAAGRRRQRAAAGGALGSTAPRRPREEHGEP